MSAQPRIIIIAGPNGAGKTTFALEFLQHEVVRQFGVETRLARMGRKTMTDERKPRHPDLIGADAALERAARRALDLALQTGTSCWVLREGKIVDIAAEARMSGPAAPQRLVAAEPTPR